MHRDLFICILLWKIHMVKTRGGQIGPTIYPSAHVRKSLFKYSPCPKKGHWSQHLLLNFWQAYRSESWPERCFSSGNGTHTKLSASVVSNVWGRNQPLQITSVENNSWHCLQTIPNIAHFHPVCDADVCKPNVRGSHWSAVRDHSPSPVPQTRCCWI